jgi:hypothetical protein
MSGEMGAKRLCQGNTAPPRPTLWLNRPLLGVPAALNVGQALAEVDVAPAQSAQFAAPEARIERCGPDWPLLSGKRPK